MKALTYQGFKDFRVESVPDPILMADDDLILKATATAICGSDLHIYLGEIPGMKDGDILGHEFIDIGEEADSGVTHLKKEGQGSHCVCDCLWPMLFIATRHCSLRVKQPTPDTVLF